MARMTRPFDGRSRAPVDDVNESRKPQLPVLLVGRPPLRERALCLLANAMAGSIEGFR